MRKQGVEDYYIHKIIAKNCCRTMAGRETQPRDTQGYQPRRRIFNDAEAALRWGAWHDETMNRKLKYNRQGYMKFDAQEAKDGYSRAKELYKDEVNRILKKSKANRSNSENKILIKWSVINDELGE